MTNIEQVIEYFKILDIDLGRTRLTLGKGPILLRGEEVGKEREIEDITVRDYQLHGRIYENGKHHHMVYVAKDKKWYEIGD